MTAKQHEELLDVIRRLPCNVAISGYWSPLYASVLQEWRLFDRRAPKERLRCAPGPFWGAGVPFRGAEGARTVLQGARHCARLFGTDCRLKRHPWNSGENLEVVKQ
jgi:hypothetical protein